MERGRGGGYGGRGVRDFGGGRGGRGDFGGRGGGRGGGPRYNSWAGETTAPPAAPTMDTSKYIGPFTWSGKELEAKENNTGEFLKLRLLPPAKVGEALEVVVNMVPLKLMQRQRCQYRVDFTPAVELRRKRIHLLHDALDGISNLIWGYDGASLLYTSALINGQEEFAFNGSYQLPDQEAVTVQVKMQFAAHQQGTLDKRSIAFFCTRFKAAMMQQKNLVAIGTDYFDLSHPEDVPEFLCQLIPGLMCTVYVSQCGPVLNTDIIFKHIRTDTVWDLMCRMRSRGGVPDDVIGMTFSHKIVMLSYTQPKKFVRVDAVRFDLSPSSRFFNKKLGAETTYADYFRKQYGITNAHLDQPQPLLENTSRTERDREGKLKVTHYIPSLCHLTGTTDEMKQDTRRSRELIRKTAMPPNERLSKIYQHLGAMLTAPEFAQQFTQWGLEMGNKLLKVPAHRLPSPTLRNGQGMVQIRENIEAWDIKFQWPMHRASAFKNWAVVSFTASPDVQHFVDMLGKVAHDLGIEMNYPSLYSANGQNATAYRKVIENEVRSQQPAFVLLVLPRNSEEPYRTLKAFLTADIGVQSQFVTIQNISKDPLLKATKVLVQMNCKAGGAPWMVDAKVGTPTMFVGLAIHHGGDLEKKGGSVAAVVSSLDRDLTRFISATFPLRLKQQVLQAPEGVPGLKETIKDAIAAFKAENKGATLKHLVVYRDGGSEGELEIIDRYEVREILAALKESGLPDCALVFFVVLKKIRTRYFAVNPSNPNEVANPAPGTTVDTHVVSPVVPEFFLCCQSVNQGSATPTKYQRIFDSSELNHETLQMYTYCLAHEYYNWNGTVREPCVLHYASVLAKFCGQVLRGRAAHANLRKVLFYL